MALRATVKRRACLLASMMMLSACGGGDGDPQGENASSATQLKVSKLRTPQNYQTAGRTQGAPIFLSEPISFSVPVNAVSFQIFMRGGDAEGACLDELIDPNEVDLFEIGDTSILDFDADYCGALVPQGPQFATTNGIWRFRLTAFDNVPDDIAITLALRTGPVPTNTSILTVQPFLASRTFSPADIKPALDEMRRIYEQAAISLEIADTIVLNEPAFSVVTRDFADPVTRQLVGQGPAGAANLFFVDDFVESGLLGVAAGIGGSLGVAGNRNGILIGLNAHLVGDQLLINLLAETSGHEMGHFLGFFHTTSQDGLDFDILADTPVCPRSTRDSNADGMVSLSECEGLGADNLMFWMADRSGSVRQTEITPDQAYVIHFSPIAR